MLHLITDDIHVGASCEWVVKEKQGDVYVPVFRNKNVFTDYGLTALASGLGGGYIPPAFIALDSWNSQVGVAMSAGATSGYTLLPLTSSVGSYAIFDFGLITQETVTILSATLTLTAGSGYAFTCNATAFAHATTCLIFAQPAIADTMNNIISEVQFDNVNFAHQRSAAIAGYSAGVGMFTLQFFLSAAQAPYYLAGAGLTDNPVVGGGNLHNHVILAYDHTPGTLDVEIDANLTIANV